jgi:hypothetical protein
MSLSEDELERRVQERAALKQEILEELKKDSLKAEILGEIKPSSDKKRLTENPLLLLLLGFIMTGLLGSWLTSHWQNRQWENQQEQLARQRSIEQKYAITDKITKSLAEAYVAVEDVLYLADNGWYERASDDKQPARFTSWLQLSRNWRVNEEVLQRDIEVNFRSAKAKALFAEIKDNWDIANNDLSLVLKRLAQKKWKAIDETDVIELYKQKIKISDLQKDAFTRIRQISKQTQELMQILLTEIQEDVESPRRGSED